MPDTQPAGGLMQALVPIVKRQPVHIIVSAGADDALHVVIQPVRVDDKEDAEIARGFSVEAPAAELDADLPDHLAQHWVPARIGLRSILDQVKSAAEQTRQTTVKKAKEGKGAPKKDAAAAGSDAQTTILGTTSDADATEAPAAAPGAAAADDVSAAQQATVPAAAPAAAASDGVPAAQQAETAAAAGEKVADSTAPVAAIPAPPAAPEEPTGTAGELALVGVGADDVSNLFD